MFAVGTRVHVTNKKCQRKEWNDAYGTVTQIVTAFNSLLNKEQEVHIVKLDNGLEAPVEETYLSEADKA